MQSSYDIPLVVASILVAVLASYTALGLGARVVGAAPFAARLWVAGGAVSMGFGIWAMHFIGMLAFHLPIPLGYELNATLRSIVPAIGASAVALLVLRHANRHQLLVPAASVVMGAGIVLMHYSGMEAMRMQPAIRYDTVLFSASVVIAITASWAALRMALQVKRLSGLRSIEAKLGRAVIMGLAIAGMHYTGMSAAEFAPGSVCLAAGQGLARDTLALLVGGGAVLMLAIALAAAMLDSLLGRHAFNEALVDALSDAGEGVLLADTRARVLFANRGMAQQTGMSVSELQDAKDFTRVFDPACRDRLDEGVRQTLAGAGARRLNVTLTRADGETRHGELAMAAVRQGERVNLLIVFTDATERHAAQRALQDSAARLSEAQQMARMGYFETDAHGRTGAVSPEVLRLLDLAPEAGRALLDQGLAAADLERLLAARRNCAATGEAYVRGYRLRLPAGHAIDLEERGRLKAGGGVVCTLQDVTARVATERELRRLTDSLEERVLSRTSELDREREFIETILDSLGVVVLLVDRRGQIVRFNRACRALTGQRPELARGRPASVLVAPQDRERFDAMFEPLTAERLPPTAEYGWIAADGTERQLAWTHAPLLGAAGQVQYVIASGIDITERKRAESSLREANAELEHTVRRLQDMQGQLVQAEKMASLGSLVAGISHEINTPIGIGVTSATALQEQLDGLANAFQSGTMKRSTLDEFLTQGRQATLIVVQNLRRAAELIGSFKQVAVDQSSDDWRHIRLHDYVDEVLISLRPRFRRAEVDVRNECDAALELHTHPGAIYQILSNLVINALVHAFEPGQRGQVVIRAWADSGQVHLDVRDDGRGVPAEHEKRIFDPFFTTRRGSGGSGLGLHIVYNLVTTTLRGSIRLHNLPDGGAQFLITFPLNRGSAET